MDRAFRIIQRIFLISGILLLLTIPITGLVSTALHWEGVCDGSTGGQTACPWWRYALNEMFWATFIFIPFLFLAALTWLGMSLAQFVRSARGKISQRRGS